jgi:hypothetical protein
MRHDGTAVVDAAVSGAVGRSKSSAGHLRCMPQAYMQIVMHQLLV